MSDEDVLRDLRETAEKVNDVVAQGQRVLANTDLVKLDERTIRFLASMTSSLLGIVGEVVNQTLKIAEHNIESFEELRQANRELGSALGFLAQRQAQLPPTIQP